MNETSMEKEFSAVEIGCNMYFCSGRKKKLTDSPVVLAIL